MPAQRPRQPTSWAHRLGVIFHPGITIRAIGNGVVSGESEFAAPWSLAAGGVVLVTQQQSDDALFMPRRRI